jgi:hypothetical protein
LTALVVVGVVRDGVQLVKLLLFVIVQVYILYAVAPLIVLQVSAFGVPVEDQAGVAATSEPPPDDELLELVDDVLLVEEVLLVLLDDELLDDELPPAVTSVAPVIVGDNEAKVCVAGATPPP